MAWDTIGNVTKDAETIKTELQDWESTVAPSSIDEWEVVSSGSNRCTIVIQYSA